MKKSKLMFFSVLMLTSCVLISMPAYAGTWQQNETGWWYQNDEGTYPVNQIKVIDGKKYYFDQNGYMSTGWKQGTKGWYYFSADGGALINTWVDRVYYIGEEGIMLTNTWTPDGYYVGNNGVWVEDAERNSAEDYKSKNEGKYHIFKDREDFSKMDFIWPQDIEVIDHKKKGHSYDNITWKEFEFYYNTVMFGKQRLTSRASIDDNSTDMRFNNGSLKLDKLERYTFEIIDDDYVKVEVEFNYRGGINDSEIAIYKKVK